MATSIQIASGPLTSTKTALNDTKAQEVLRRYALANGADPGSTNQQFLDYVVDTITKEMIDTARRQIILEAEMAAQIEAQTGVDF